MGVIGCWVQFQCRGILLIWIIVVKGPTVLVVGADGVVWTFFSHLSFLSSFSLSMGDCPVQTEILSQRAEPKTTNQSLYICPYSQYSSRLSLITKNML